MREETSFVDSTNFKIIINYKITNCLQLRFDNFSINCNNSKKQYHNY